MSYKFEHSINCPVNTDFAWRFWSDVSNWAKVDPAVESVEIAGPFASGTTGVTHIRGAAPAAWKLVDVKSGKSATVEITAPGAVIHFQWLFQESPDGQSVLTQRVSLEGEQATDYQEGIKQLEQNLPDGMKRLAEAIVKAARSMA